MSLYFFLKKIPEDQFDGTMEELLEDFVKGEVVYDSWWDHVNQFTKLDNIHIVHFEDLLEVLTILFLIFAVILIFIYYNLLKEFHKRNN